MTAAENPLRLGLRENIAQFALPVCVNMWVRFGAPGRAEGSRWFKGGWTMPMERAW